MTEARIPPGERADVGSVNWAIARIAGRVAGTAPPNLFLTLGRHRRLFRRWLRFAGGLMPGGRLRRRETELVILRVAHLCSSSYEFEHHVRLGRRAGLRDVDFDAITGPLDRGPWSEREAAMLAAVDQLHGGGDLDDSAWAALRRHLDDRDCIELLLLVGHYEMLATFLRTLRVPHDSRG
ncbi:MAG TPA: carboxymuconolactone decarboxylase family protein [Actinomycetota bacterium]|jgi:alkylhydroperoxidase family enzyme